MLSTDHRVPGLEPWVPCPTRERSELSPARACRADISAVGSADQRRRGTMSLPEHTWDLTQEVLKAAATFAAGRLSRDDVAPSSAVGQPVIPNLRRTAAPGRGAY